MLLFVYGTLKRGFHNNYFLRNSKFLEEFKTAPRFTMISLGGFPGLHEEGDTSIQGELWQVPAEDVPSIDMLEGYPDFYSRGSIETPHGTAVVYVLPKTDAYARCEKVVNGNWSNLEY